jgi:hypothetical protein
MPPTRFTIPDDPHQSSVTARALNQLGAGMPELVNRMSRLVEDAALHLGLSEEDASIASRSAVLTAGDKTVSMLPLGPSDTGGLSLVLSVQTSVPVCGDRGSAGVIAVLQHAPGALHALAASLGATPDGFWIVHRLMRVCPDGGAALAAGVRESVHLADYVLRGEHAGSH